jgi:hypothetical protein
MQAKNDIPVHEKKGHGKRHNPLIFSVGTKAFEIVTLPFQGVPHLARSQAI